MNPSNYRRKQPRPAYRAVPTPGGLTSIQRFDPWTARYTHIFATGQARADAVVDELNTEPDSPLHEIYEPCM